MTPLVLAATLVALPVVVAFGVAALRRPLDVLLPVYAAFVPFGSGLVLPLGVPRAYSSISSLLGLALVAVLLLHVLGGGRGPRRMPGAVPVWLLFLGVVAATTFWSINPSASVVASLNMTATVVLFVLLALSDVDRRALERLGTGILVGAAVSVLYGLAQAITGTLPTQELGAPRFGSDLLGANHTAAALLLPLAIALWRATSADRARTRRLNYALVLLLLTGVLLTQSRGGLLGVAAVLVAVLACSKQRGRVLAATGVAVVATAVVLVTTPAGFGERQTETGSSGRTDIWRVGAQACVTYCPTGSGWGTFGEVYEQNQSSTASANVRRKASFEPHDVWLLVAVEAGVVAAVLLLMGLLLAFRDALAIPAHLRGPAIGSLAGLLVTGIFLSNFEFKYFWLVLAYVVMSFNALAPPEQPAPGDSSDEVSARARADSTSSEEWS